MSSMLTASERSSQNKIDARTSRYVAVSKEVPYSEQTGTDTKSVILKSPC
jgi:hypothetical protein